MKSLIIEDEFTNRVILQDTLSKFGSSHVAVSGKEAFTAFAIAAKLKQPYDLICLDLKLPDMDGMVILKKIRNLEAAQKITAEKATKIIMVTAIGNKQMVMKAIKNQCNAYMVKPVEIAKLLGHLRNFKLIENKE